MTLLVSHNANMPKRPRKQRTQEQLEAYKEASGWYLAAWRDYRGLTLEELAEEVGTSKGVVSDLETGAKRANGQLAQRFNKDDVSRFAKALDTTGGFLLDMNPFTVDPDTYDLGSKIQRLDRQSQSLVRDLTERLLGSSGKR